MTPFSGALRQRAGLLLMLAAALVGFLLLIELLDSVTSSGPDSLVAPVDSDDSQIRLPGIGGVFSYALTVAAVVAAVVGLLAYRSRLSEEDARLTRRPMLIAGGVALVFVVAIALLAFSAPLNPGEGLGEHLASRGLIPPAGVVVLTVFFMSVAIVAVLRPSMLLVLLVVWALVGLATGLLDLPGLQLPDSVRGQTGVAGEGLAEQERRGIDGRVFFVLMGFTLSLAVALAIGRSPFIIGCVLLWIIAGFLFVLFGPERLGGPVAEFDPFQAYGDAMFGEDDISNNVTLTHGIIAALLAFASICLVVVGIIGFLRHRNRARVGGAPVWSKLTWWIVGPIVLGLLFSMCTSPVLGGGGLGPGLDLVGTDGEVDGPGGSGSGEFAEEVGKYRNSQEVFPLENGNIARIDESSLLVNHGAWPVEFLRGSQNPLFTVTGAAHTTHLRNATGDVYENGSWTQLDPVDVATSVGQDIPAEVASIISEGMVFRGSGSGGQATVLQPHRVVPELLVRQVHLGAALHTDQIVVTPVGRAETFSAGSLPVPDAPVNVSTSGSWRPFSGTFQSPGEVGSYETRALSVQFAEEALTAAETAEDPTYYQLPEDLSGRIGSLASEITSGLQSPFRKALAIEAHLRDNYAYIELEEGQESPHPSGGDDPVEWFLFDRMEGGSSAFSSAFVLLARSSGVPARVVSGWRIQPVSATQAVNGTQARQWAEIALADLGWVTFDPTPDKDFSASLAETLDQDPGLPGSVDSGRPGNEQPGAGDGIVIPEQAREDLSQLISMALHHLASSADPLVRSDAAATLGGIGGESVLAALAEAALNDPNGGVREAAIRAVAMTDFEALSDILAGHEDDILRIAAAQGMGQTGEELALGPLTQALLNDLEPEVRAAAAESLGSLGEESALLPLAESLVDNPDSAEPVRAAAARSLGQLGETGAVAPLALALQSDPDESVKAASATALGELGDTQGIEQLADTLAGGDPASVRAAAALALGAIATAQSLPPLVEARDEDDSPAVRSAAAEALEDIPSSELADALTGDADADARAVAAELLGERGDPAAAPELIEALSDPEPEVREAAEGAVNALGTVTSLENGGGLLDHSAGVSFIPGTTTQQAPELSHHPVFEVQGELTDGFLRVAVGDRYVDGRWFPDEEEGVEYSAGSSLAGTGEPVQPTVEPESWHLNRISVKPIGGEGTIPEGMAPTSTRLQTLSVKGTYFPGSQTFATGRNLPSYNWISQVPVFSEAQLNAATVSGDYPHASLPEHVPDRVRGLAMQIIEGHDTAYQKAKALEQFLRANYRYNLADPATGGVPDGQDPVDWFLFESREGTCGNFSSAFTVMARAVGLPARVVSGWSVLAGPAVAATAFEQTVYTDQAHQRAEVAFDGLGWIAFEPTAAGGAPGRVPAYALAGGTQFRAERTELESLVEELESGDPEVRGQVLEQLEDKGAVAEVTENGGAVVSRDGQGLAISAGTTTTQAHETAVSGTGAVFVVSGAAHTQYLRSAVGDVYEGGQWSQLDPREIEYAPGTSIPHRVREQIAASNSLSEDLPPERTNYSLLASNELKAEVVYADTIQVEAGEQLGSIPAGVVPTSRFLSEVSIAGVFHPFSATFELEEGTASYGWTSLVPRFTEEQLNAAAVVSDPTYTQLPEGLPSRIRGLALQVTQGQDSAYAKARALESFLSAQYTYRFADVLGQDAAPEGRDPVDWFLFDHQEGTCGAFSTAFVVMARSVGIPARVVSGWAIAATPEPQQVMIDQAHQWAEVALVGVGWISFDPTAPQGPRSRIPAIQDTEPEKATGTPIATVTEITVWPERIRRRTEFTIGGTVATATGKPVSGVTVEIYINETKAHGGTVIGETIVHDGTFSSTVSLPTSFLTGNYQLLARAVDNGRYGESWSDPDVTVYSGSGLQLTGPQEVNVDSRAIFTGRFVDDSGDGVEDATLLVTIDGRAIPAQPTGPAGEFSFSHTFLETGQHRVEVTFDGGDLLLASYLRLDLTAVMPTVLTLSPVGQVNLGESFTIEGALHNVRGEPLVGAEVSVAVYGGTTQTAVTDASGGFSASAFVQEFGEFQVEAEYRGEYPVLPSSQSTLAVAKDSATLTVSGPATVSQGESATFHGSVTASSLREIGTLEVVIEDGDGNLLEVVASDEDGYFQYRTGILTDTGLHIISARIAPNDRLNSSSASYSYSVLAPTVLTVSGTELARAGETVQLSGSLLGEAGQAVPGVPIWVGDAETPPLVTSEDGSFTLEVTVEAELGEFDVQSIIKIPFGFEGTVHLAPALAEHSITVGIPRLSLEEAGTVVRGETASIRGAVFIGNHPLPGARVELERAISASTFDTGSFALEYPVSRDAALGSNVLTVTVPDLGLQSEVSILVKTSSNLTAFPVGEVKRGEEVMLQATLTDDSGAGIAGAVLNAGSGFEGTTDGNGVASIPLMVPDEEELQTVPVTVSYGGDEFREPVTYRVAVPVSPTSFNWLLWVGLPVLLVAVAASAFAARRWGNISIPLGAGLVPSRLRLPFGRGTADEAEGRTVSIGPDGVEPADLEPCSLEVNYDRPAPDLPDVWGPGESVTIGIILYGENGQGIQAGVEVEDPDGSWSVVETDMQGGWSFVWTAHEPGAFHTAARFPGNDRFQEASDSRELRVVDFREEIVRLYNSFEEWAVELVPGVAGRTSRELESILVGSGMTFDYRALDEIISRFEEADYSEHDIERRQYEAMYRAWYRIVGS